jgi:ABC-type branched-subunit amino acid transport system substrate-binding protein
VIFSKVISVTFLPRKLPAAAHGFAALAIAAALMLGACQGARVQKGQGETQATTSDEAVFPPGVLPETDPFYQSLLEPEVAPNPPSPNVGLLLPLSGRHTEIGRAMRNAAQLAVFDIADDQFRLIVRDSGGTAAGAREAAQSALDAGASLVLGPLFGASVAAVAEEAQARAVNVIAFSNDMSVAGANVFVMGLAPGPQIERVVGYAAAQGLQRFALLAPNNSYGHAVITATQGAVSGYGAELTRLSAFDPAAPDPSPQVRALGDYDERKKALEEQRAELETRGDETSLAQLEELENLDTIGSPEFEAVLLPLGGQSLMTIAPLLAFYDIDPEEVQFMGTALWDDPRLGSEVTLRGGWYAAPSPALWKEFSGRYKAVYGDVPPRLAALAYDATALAAVLARSGTQVGANPDFGSAAITQASGFAGIDGIFRFRPTGEIERGLAVLEMGQKGITVLDPAPVSFERLIN